MCSGGRGREAEGRNYQSGGKRSPFVTVLMKCNRSEAEDKHHDEGHSSWYKGLMMQEMR